VHRTLLAAAISPDNTPHGYNLTFAFPMLMFIIIATALYLRFRSSHRVPGHVAFGSARWTDPKAAEQGTHSEALAAQPAAAAVEQPDTGQASAAHGASLTAEATQTTSGSSLQEGTAEDDAAPESTEGSE
jgi:hypothetical protein